MIFDSTIYFCSWIRENVAQTYVEAREEGPFLSKEDLNKKAGLSQKVIEYLDELGSLPNLPDKHNYQYLICNRAIY